MFSFLSWSPLGKEIWLCWFFRKWWKILAVYVFVKRSLGLPRWHSGKESACQCRRPKRLWVKKIPWSRKWQLAPIFLLGKFPRQRSLAGCSPCGHRESDMTQWLGTQREVQCFPIFFLDMKIREQKEKKRSSALECKLYESRASLSFIHW